MYFIMQNSRSLKEAFDLWTDMAQPFQRVTIFTTILQNAK